MLPGAISEAPPASAPAIAIRDLRKVYEGRAAVDGLTLTVPRGCFFGFLGPNGAGKSTTIRMLTGLIAPTSGAIELLGLPMPAQELEIKQRIGLVPDESLLFDRLTGREFLEFVGRMYSLARPLAIERASELLDLFELAERRANSSPNIRKACANASPWPRPSSIAPSSSSWMNPSKASTPSAPAS